MPETLDFQPASADTELDFQPLGQTDRQLDFRPVAPLSTTPETDKAIIEAIPKTLSPEEEIAAGKEIEQAHPAIKNAAQAAIEFVSGMVPRTPEQYFGQIYAPFAAFQQAKQLAGGDISSIPIVGRIPEIYQADKTPAFSKERFLTAAKTLMDLGLLAGAGAPELPKAAIGGEIDAIKPGYAQVEAGETPQRVETRPSREVEGAGYSDQIERGAQREAPGVVPQEPVPAEPAVAATPPEGAHGEGIRLSPELQSELERRSRVDIEDGLPPLTLPKLRDELVDEINQVLATTGKIPEKWDAWAKKRREQISELNKAIAEPIGAVEPTPVEIPPVEPGEPPRRPPPAVARPEEMVGPGAASREEYMRRYALVGASKLLEGHTELGQFSLEMTKEFGQGVSELLPEIFDRSKQVVNEFQTATGKSDVAREINRQIGATRATETPVMVRPFTAYKASLLAQERAGTAGYSRGLREARTEAKAAMTQFKGDINQADKFMAGDQEQVRKNLVEFVNHYLPPPERGAFINRITSALRRPSIMRGDPAVMYRHAFDVMQDIESRAEQVYRDNLVDDIKKVATRASNSPSVDLAAKRIMQRMLSDVNLRNMTEATRRSLENSREYLNRQRGLGKDVFIPEKVLEAIDSLGKRSVKDLPTDVLENLHNKISLAERLGRFKFKTRQQVWQAERQERLGDILAGRGTPMELRPQFRPQPGENLTAEQKISNHLARFWNHATAFDIGHLPEDVIFDMMGNTHGTYTGPLFDHIRTPVDAGYDAAEYKRMEEVNPLREIIDRHKLHDKDEDEIGLWAALQQDNGEARALETASQETINKLKAKGLTPGQKEAYDYMRKTLDASLPEIQNVMHDLYNIQVVPERNYFPWMREYDVFRATKESIVDARTGETIPESDLSNFGKIAGNFFRRNTSQIPRGFTLERLPGAEGPIRMDSFAVFERHMRNAARLREMQRSLKMAGEIIRDPRFLDKHGRFAQTLANDWLTAAATDGAGSGVYRWPMIDMFRRGANRSLVFFRLTSNIKHASAIPQGVTNSGGFNWYWNGLHHQFTAKGKAFLGKFPQVMQRQAGDMSLQELQDTMSSMAPMRWADRWGFVLGKELDAINSRAVFIGRYLKNLKAKGLNPSLEGAIDRQAAYNAMAFMRRTVSSTLAKDIQPVLGRGMGFGGNVTVARSMNAFRQYALERWSLMRYDVPESFKSGNYLRGLALMGAVGAASVYEVSIPIAIKKGWNMLFHVPENKKHDESMFMRLSKDLFSMGPYTNNLIAMMQWGETGTPLVDIPVSMGKALHTMTTAKHPVTRQRAMARAGFTAAELAGVPGSGFMESVVMPKLFPPQRPSGRIRKKLQ